MKTMPSGVSLVSKGEGGNTKGTLGPRQLEVDQAMRFGRRHCKNKSTKENLLQQPG